MYVNYEYYKLFYYVAKYKSVSKAAKVLCANQPNLTRSIKMLEQQLGCDLFVRANRGMELTVEGEKLFEHVKIAIESIESGEDEIVADKNFESGYVRVAASEVALHCVLLPVLMEYRMKYPNVKLNIGNHSTPQAIESIKNGVADFAVVTTPTCDFAAITQKTVCKFREVAVCGSAFSELTGRKVCFSELAEYPLISLGENTKSFELYSHFFADLGLVFKPDIQAATADQILPMVKADLGIGFVPEKFISNFKDVLVIDTEVALPEREIRIVKRKNQVTGIAAKELENMIISQGSEI